MKKFLVLMLTMVLSFTLCACGNDTEKDNGEKNDKVEEEEKVVSKTCTLEPGDGSKSTVVVSSNKENEINNIEMVMVYDSTYLGTDVSTFTATEKETVKSEMLKTFGFDKNTYDGFSIVIDVTDVVTVTVKANLETADPALLQKIGMDFSSTNMDLDRFVEDMTSSGVVCK